MMKSDKDSIYQKNSRRCISIKIYAIIVFAIAILFIIFGILIYNGKTELIHSYHLESVKDKDGYSKAMGKTLISLSLSLIVSGVIALFSNFKFLDYIAIGILFVGIIFFSIILFRVQKKYNGGV